MKPSAQLRDWVFLVIALLGLALAAALYRSQSLSSQASRAIPVDRAGPANPGDPPDAQPPRLESLRLDSTRS